MFGASLHVQILPFAVSLLLSIVEMFALGLVLVALLPTQAVANPSAGVVTFGLMFLSGLWVQSGTGGRPLADDHVLLAERRGGKGSARFGFNGSPSYAALLTMAVYAVIFGFIAIRYFRWE